MNERKEAEWLDVCGGPSREDVRDSIGSKPGRRIWLIFKVDVPEHLVELLHTQMGFEDQVGVVELECLVNSMSWLDNSGENFVLKGRTKPKSVTPYQLTPAFLVEYQTDRRQGRIKIGATS